MSAPRSFDHTAVAHLPEYQETRRALDRLARAIGQAEVEMSQADFVEAVGDMARTTYAGDDCRCCTVNVGRTTWPHAAVVEDAELLGTYRCPRTERTWTCWWTADPDRIGRMP